MKRVITLLLAFVLILSLCACGSKELSAEERERIYQEVAAEKAAAEETAGIEMKDLFGVWYDMNSKATIEIKEDAAHMNSVTIWSADGSGITDYGWHIANGELVNYPVVMPEEILKEYGSLYKRIKIVESDGVLQLHHLSGVYVREDDLATAGISNTAQGVAEDENRQLDEPIVIIDDEMLTAEVTQFYKDKSYSKNGADDCIIVIRVKNNSTRDMLFYFDEAYLEDESLYLGMLDGNRAPSPGKAGYYAYLLRYDTRPEQTPLDDLDQLYDIDGRASISVFSEDGEYLEGALDREYTFSLKK